MLSVKLESQFLLTVLIILIAETFFYEHERTPILFKSKQEL